MADTYTMDDVANKLGLGAMPDVSVLNQILYKCRHEGLAIYFNEPINGVETNHGTEPLPDREGNVSRVYIGVQPTYFYDCRKAIISPETSIDGNITISTFKSGDEEYYSVTECGTYLQRVSMSFKCFYCICSDIDLLIDKPKSPKNKQKKREDVLDKLIQGISLSILVPMGRKGVWDELRRQDPKLFPILSDGAVKGFFDKQSAIKFPKGRK